MRHEHPNLFATICSFGGGNIVIRDSKNQAELMRIENVLFLWFRINWINERLMIRVVSQNDQAALIEEEGA